MDENDDDERWWSLLFHVSMASYTHTILGGEGVFLGTFIHTPLSFRSKTYSVDIVSFNWFRVQCMYALRRLCWYVVWIKSLVAEDGHGS